MNYARILPGTVTVEKVLDLAPEYVELLAPSKRECLRPLVFDAQPAAGAGQVVEDAGYVIEPAQVRQTWRLRDKTTAELEQDAENAERQQLKASSILDMLKAEAAGTSQLTAAQARKLFARCVLWLIVNRA